ncbi:MAG: AMP-binding protein, partial [Rhodothermales bacterium]
MPNPFRLLEHNARNFPNRPAFDDGKETLTYVQLCAYSRRVAAKLGELGISSGQLVATCLPGKLD